MLMFGFLLLFLSRTSCVCPLVVVFLLLLLASFLSFISTFFCFLFLLLGVCPTFPCFSLFRFPCYPFAMLLSYVFLSLAIENENTRSSFISTSGQSGSSQNRRKSSGFFTSEPMLRIHLVYVKGLVNENNVEDIRKSIATTEGEKETGMKASASKDDTDGNNSIGYEFMMEVSNLEEKYAWLAAIDAHTSYIEAIANYGNAGELGNWQLGQEIEIDESRSPSLASIYPSATTGKNDSVL
jgi:hypothetical protein